jgi:hypothetical protein
MRRGVVVREALRRLNLSKIDYKSLRKSPEGCLKILSHYLPLIMKERDVPSDEFIGILDRYFEKALTRVPEKELSKHYDAYNTLFARYSPDYLPALLNESAPTEVDFRDALDYEDPSNEELSKLEAMIG